MPNPINNGLTITAAALKKARQGLGECIRCRSMLDDARALGYPLPNIEQQIEEVQPRLEGVIAFEAAQRGVDYGG